MSVDTTESGARKGAAPPKNETPAAPVKRRRGRPWVGQGPRTTKSVTLADSMWERIALYQQPGEPLSYVVERLLRQGLRR